MRLGCAMLFSIVNYTEHNTPTYYNTNVYKWYAIYVANPFSSHNKIIIYT